MAHSLLSEECVRSPVSPFFCRRRVSDKEQCKQEKCFLNYTLHREKGVKGPRDGWDNLNLANEGYSCRPRHAPKSKKCSVAVKPIVHGLF